MIHSGQYSVKNVDNLMVPHEGAKVKQFFDDAKKKENNKSNTCNAAGVVTQEDAPREEDKGIKPHVASNVGIHFSHAANVWQKLLSTDCCQLLMLGTGAKAALDSHADTCVLLVPDNGRQLTVHPCYGGEFKPIQEVSIASVATMWIHPPENGQLYILITYEALYVGD